MRIVTLASGSGGNCTLVIAGGSCFLIDAGISLKRILSGLSAEGISPEELTGVLITHEHSDHISGLAALVKRTQLPVLAPHTVAARLLGKLPEIEEHISIIHTAQTFELGKSSVTAFHTSHDTDESVGYRIDAEASFGLATDLGTVTDEVRDALAGVDAALVEANHDEAMLRDGPYPAYLKRRILSERGHLSNESGAVFAAYLAERGATRIILGHLSRTNNTPEKALAAGLAALGEGWDAGALAVAPPDRPLALEVRARCSV